jgi:hypothetical protein
MELNDLLKGRFVNVMTDAKVFVQLEIEDFKENRTTRTVQITPDTKENDWWGESVTYTDVNYTVTFTNGFKKDYNSLKSIDLVE